MAEKFVKPTLWYPGYSPDKKTVQICIMDTNLQPVSPDSVFILDNPSNPESLAALARTARDQTYPTFPVTGLGVYGLYLFGLWALEVPVPSIPPITLTLSMCLEITALAPSRRGPEWLALRDSLASCDQLTYIPATSGY